MRTGEPRLAAIEREFLDACDAVVGETLDDAPLACDDCGNIGAHAGDFDADLAGRAREVRDLGRAQLGFRRHAAAQDAQPAELSFSLYECCALAEPARGGRRGKACAARADDAQIKLMRAHGAASSARLCGKASPARASLATRQTSGRHANAAHEVDPL